MLNRTGEETAPWRAPLQAGILLAWGIDSLYFESWNLMTELKACIHVSKSLTGATIYIFFSSEKGHCRMDKGVEMLTDGGILLVIFVRLLSTLYRNDF